MLVDDVYDATSEVGWSVDVRQWSGEYVVAVGGLSMMLWSADC